MSVFSTHLLSPSVSWRNAGLYWGLRLRLALHPVSVTVDDFGPQAANATSSREHDSNSASAVSPLLVRQFGTAFRHQFKN